MAYVENSELSQLAGDINGRRHSVVRDISQVVKKGAVNIKRDARAKIQAQTRGKYTSQYPSTIDFDMVDDLSAEIGPRARGQGNLGHLFEYGSPMSGSMPHLNPALDEEIPRFVKAVGDVVERISPK
ncbi:hypothetical protein [Actinotignum urinale]|uniref:hypothetical protein n=1 Tax=Actinotignum urinale TaxID=190146 RepID=UPI0003B37DF1|nr:hypothetical protein [Actinotignum urinale]MDY5159567.1 hypothetical protein [Actinotignum urinale]